MQANSPSDIDNVVHFRHARAGALKYLSKSNFDLLDIRKNKKENANDARLRRR
jgi:hypothetical protein